MRRLLVSASAVLGLVAINPAAAFTPAKRSSSWSRRVPAAAPTSSPGQSRRSSRRNNLVQQPIVVTLKGGGSGAEGFVYGKTGAGDPHRVVFGTSKPVAAADGREGRLEAR